MQQKSVQRENIILQSHTGSEAARAREDGAIPGHHPVLLAPHFPPRCLSPTPPNFTEACVSSPSAKYSLPLCAALKPGPGALGVYLRESQEKAAEGSRWLCFHLEFPELLAPLILALL